MMSMFRHRGKCKSFPWNRVILFNECPLLTHFFPYMADTQQTLNADASGLEAGQENAMVDATTVSGEGSADALEQADLALIERATGRKFATHDDAEKYLKNLNSLVGDNVVSAQREEAKLYKAVITQYANENGMNYAEAKQAIENLVTPSSATPAASPASQNKQVYIDPRIDELERKDFLRENPLAVPYLDKIDRYAKLNGQTLSAAYNELYGDIFAEKAKQEQTEAKRKEKIAASVPTSVSAPASAPSIPESKRLMEEYQKTGNNTLLREAIKARAKETYTVKDE